MSTLHSYMKQTTDRQNVFAGEEALSRKRQQKAAEVGLPWPPPAQKKRRVGAPSRQDLWQDRLYNLLGENKFQMVKAAGSATVPPWWRKGMPVDGPAPQAVSAAASSLGSAEAPAEEGITTEDISEALLADPAGDSPEDILDAWAAAAPAAADSEAETVPQAEAVSEGPSSSALPAPGVVPPRRKNKAKFVVPREAQVWFLRWAHYMKVKHDVSWRASWEVAGRICPALFSKGDKNAFRRWRAADAEPTESTDMGGRKSHIGLAQRQELQVMVHSLVARGFL